MISKGQYLEALIFRYISSSAAACYLPCRPPLVVHSAAMFSNFRRTALHSDSLWMQRRQDEKTTARGRTPHPFLSEIWSSTPRLSPGFDCFFPRLPLTELNLTCHVDALVRIYARGGGTTIELIAMLWLSRGLWLWRLDNRRVPLFDRRVVQK